jgi:hypothetical protein
MSKAVVVVRGKRALASLPPSITRALVLTNSSFVPPPGWRETPGATHKGRNSWVVPVARNPLEEESISTSSEYDLNKCRDERDALEAKAKELERRIPDPDDLRTVLGGLGEHWASLPEHQPVIRRVFATLEEA